MTPPHATVAILSIGQMGLGIASLLIAHDFRVITNVSDRSAATQERAKSASIELCASDVEVVAHADYILSIVPPRDADEVAKRVIAALQHPGVRRHKLEALWFLDLNAGSPGKMRQMVELFKAKAPEVRVLDGGIIGSPPQRKQEQDGSGGWKRPGIPLCGPFDLHNAPLAGEHLATVLNVRYLSSSDMGAASGLKACFAALTKGFTALAIQSYTTAHALSVLPELQDYLEEYNPGARQRAERGIVGCTGKAGRWVEEMRGIGETVAGEGGFGEAARVFGEIAGVYEAVAALVGEGGLEGVEGVEDVVGRLGGFVREEKEKKE